MSAIPTLRALLIGETKIAGLRHEAGAGNQHLTARAATVNADALSTGDPVPLSRPVRK